MRYFIEFSYRGTAYVGWQRQPNGLSVQACMEDAIQLLFKMPVGLTAAGRTDAGVHAQYMVAHVDVEDAIDPAFWVQKLNAYLPADIAIYAIHPVHDAAHARFDATARTYQYHIHTHKNPFVEGQSWYCPQGLDFEAMQQACAYLMGEQDFQCFSKVDTDVNHYRCTLTHAEWTQTQHGWVFTVTANRFLRNMVRAIVGSLHQIGKGRWQPEHMQQIIQSKLRSEAGFSAPAHGLFLTHITYPTELFTPLQAPIV